MTKRQFIILYDILSFLLIFMYNEKNEKNMGEIIE